MFAIVLHLLTKINDLQNIFMDHDLYLISKRFLA